MNKLVTFFLITVFLCANTSIGELLKVPNLVEHYKQHIQQASNSSASFVDFIIDHYAKNTDNDLDEHQNLPFKTFDHTSNVLFVFPISHFKLETEKVAIVTNETFVYKNSFKSNLFTSIWLPPKIA